MLSATKLLAKASPEAASSLLVTQKIASKSVSTGNSVIAGCVCLTKYGHVEVTLAYSHDHLTLRVLDDGCGFDAGPKERHQDHHFGLRGMRERTERSGGRFRLDTAPGKGASIEAKLPRKR